MTQGRKPKPTEQKIRIGNPGKRKLPDVVTPIPVIKNLDIPEPHRPLIGTADEPGPGRELWNRIWTSGCAWIRRDTDIEIVQIICEQIDERQVLRTKLFSNGDWRDRAQLRHLERSISANLASLGFSPTDRARLGMNQTSTDALQDFRDRIATRRALAQ